MYNFTSSCSWTWRLRVTGAKDFSCTSYIAITEASELNSFQLTPGKFKALKIFHFQLQLILQVPKFKSLWYQTAEGSRLQWCFPHDFHHIYQHFFINHAVFILLRHFCKIIQNAFGFFLAHLRTTFAIFISMEGMALEELNNWLSTKFEIQIVQVELFNYPLKKY